MAGPGELEAELHAKVVRACGRMNALFERKEYDRVLHEVAKTLESLPAPRNQWQAATALLACAGDALFMLKRYQESRDALREALTCPDELGKAFAHMRLGQIALLLGDHGEATVEAKRAYACGGAELIAKHATELQWLVDAKKE